MKKGELTVEQVAELKAKHGGELFVIEVKLAPDEVAVAYLKPADRNTVAYALRGIAKDQILEPGEHILTNCFVAGDERLKLTTGFADTKPQQAAAQAALALVKTMEATVKNG